MHALTSARAFLARHFRTQSNPAATTRRRARDLHTEAFAPLESLEQRALLTSDLGVAWDNDGLNLPSKIVPGDRILAPIFVVNNGPMAAVGLLTINFYLSTNTTFDASDTLVRSYDREPITLPVYTGNPDDIGTFTGDLTIPAGTAAGNYFLIVRLLPNNQIGDANQSNNIAASDDSWALVHRFGTFDGRTNVALAMKDAEGTIIAYTLTGGGYGEVTTSPDGFGVTLFNTGGNSQAAAQASGGDGKFDFVSVTINGSVNSFFAPDGRLRGPLTATTGFGAMTFGDVPGPLTITVPNTSASPSFDFDNVTNLTINSAVGITRLDATTWLDNDSTPDRVTAPWLGELNIFGNTNVNLLLTGRGGGQPTLGPVNITGVIKGGAWSVNGIGSSITAMASTVLFSATFNQRLDSLTTTTGTFRGVLTARNITTINIGRDILASKILAGAYLGADGRLGGTGADADVFRQGVITTINVVHNTANSIIGAGFDPVDGLFKNGNDRIIGGTKSKIGTINIANISGKTTRFLAAQYGAITFGGQAVDWRTSNRFILSTTAPTASITSFTPTSDAATFIIRFTSTSLMDLTSIRTGTLRVTGPGGYSQIATLIAGPTGVSSRTAANATFQITAPEGGWQPPFTGEFTISIEPDVLADARGNISATGPIGTVTI